MPNTPQSSADNNENPEVIPDFMVSPSEVGTTDVRREMKEYQQLILELKINNAEQAETIQNLQQQIMHFRKIFRECLLNEIF